jgi:hypothetical protein
MGIEGVACATPITKVSAVNRVIIASDNRFMTLSPNGVRYLHARLD